MGLSRREILDEQELLPAPRASQQLFWLRYNRGKRGWRTVHLSDALAGVVSNAAIRSAQRLEGLAEAWGQVVPAEYAASTRVESYRGGRLVVTVDSAATKYVLARQPLLQILNEQVWANEGRRASAIKLIEFRIGTPAPRTGEPRREPRQGPSKGMTRQS